MITPRIELLNTGSELLLGNVRDLHLSWFGKELFPFGLRISRQMTVPDGALIRDALVEAFPRTEILIITGGLGPTTDDMTRELVAELLGRRLSLQQEILDEIRERCRQRGFVFQSRMERQAMVPEGAIVLSNAHGSAPGLYIPAMERVSSATPHIFLLPGPPMELQPMARSYLFPFLKNLTLSNKKYDCRIYRIIGMGESMVETLVGLELSQRGDLEVGYCARPNEVDFRLIGSREVLEKVEPLVLAAVGEHLVSDQGEGLEEVVVNLLKKTQATLATAESCTGGLLTSRLTDVPGASEVFLEGLVTYSNQAKSDLLNVPAALLALHGAVSEEVACAMADGVRARSGASHALATTGIAGPGGGSLEKPVGTVWIALSSEGKKTEAWREYFPVDRISFKQEASQSALDHLRKLLQKSTAKPK